MTLRTRLLLYFAAVHLLFAAVAVFVLLERQSWMVAVEAALALSLLAGWILIRKLFVPLDMITTGSELMAEQDFSARFREVGQPELDRLVHIYNAMIDRLREERLRLEEQNRFLDRIISASPSGVITCDFDGRIETVNAAASHLLGEPAVGRTLSELGNPVADALTRLTTGESLVVSVAGGRRLRCSRGELLDRGFQRPFFLVDELTEELRASERSAYEKLIRMISHEVNNSVGAVRSLLDSSLHYGVQLNDEDRTDFREAVAVAQTRLDNLNRFTNGFAEVVRIPPPDLRPCDLETLVADLLTLLRPELRRRNIEATVSGQAGAVEADKNQMEQVLLNVLKNAMESIGSNGRIDISFSDGEMVIADSGAGFNAEVAAQLFTPFFSTKRDGRGLGLTIVQEILTQHHFDFALRPRAGVGGAEFVISGL